MIIDEIIAAVATLTKEEICRVRKALSARIQALIDANPNVYVIRRIYKGQTQFQTWIEGHSSPSFLARDLTHSELSVYSTPESAEGYAKWARDRDRVVSTQIDVLPVAKDIYRTLPVVEYSQYKQVRRWERDLESRDSAVREAAQEGLRQAGKS